MIGDIAIGKSFFHCISYCLEDKKGLTEEQKKLLTKKDGCQHTNRAEVLSYNLCYGDKQELADQFNEVAALSKRVEKPVLHLSLTLPEGEQLSRQQLIAAGEALAKAFGVANHQYLIVQHKDTPRQHIHLVANRVGYDGKAVSTSNNYLKMQQLCRSLEKKYNLQEVLSSKKFLPKAQQQIPRKDKRKEQMKADIKRCVQGSTRYQQFEKKMQQLGYRIIKGRGISFIDPKKVKVKGSALGYSLATIEKMLAQNRSLQTSTRKQDDNTTEKTVNKEVNPRTESSTLQDQSTPALDTGLAGLLADFLNPDYDTPDIIPQPKKKKKRRYPGS